MLKSNRKVLVRKMEKNNLLLKIKEGVEVARNEHYPHRWGLVNLDDAKINYYFESGQHKFVISDGNRQSLHSYDNHELTYDIPVKVQDAILENLEGDDKLVRKIISFLSPSVSESSYIWTNVLPETMCLGNVAKNKEILEKEYNEKNKKLKKEKKKSEEALKRLRSEWDDMNGHVLEKIRELEYKAHLAIVSEDYIEKIKLKNGVIYKKSSDKKSPPCFSKKEFKIQDLSEKLTNIGMGFCPRDIKSLDDSQIKDLTRYELIDGYYYMSGDNWHYSYRVPKLLMPWKCKEITNLITDSYIANRILYNGEEVTWNMSYDPDGELMNARSSLTKAGNYLVYWNDYVTHYTYFKMSEYEYEVDTRSQIFFLNKLNAEVLREVMSFLSPCAAKSANIWTNVQPKSATICNLRSNVGHLPKEEDAERVVYFNSYGSLVNCNLPIGNVTGKMMYFKSRSILEGKPYYSKKLKTRWVLENPGNLYTTCFADQKEILKKRIYNGEHISQIWVNGESEDLTDEEFNNGVLAYRYIGKHVFQVLSGSKICNFYFENKEIDFKIPWDVQLTIEKRLLGNETLAREIVSYLSKCVSESSYIWSNRLPESMTHMFHALSDNDLEEEYNLQYIPNWAYTLATRLKKDPSELQEEDIPEDLKEEFEQFNHRVLKKSGSGSRKVYYRENDSVSVPCFGKRVELECCAAEVMKLFNRSNPILSQNLVYTMVPMSVHNLNKNAGLNLKRNEYHKMYYIMTMIKKELGHDYCLKITKYPTYDIYIRDIIRKASEFKFDKTIRVFSIDIPELKEVKGSVFHFFGKGSLYKESEAFMENFRDPVTGRYNLIDALASENVYEEYENPPETKFMSRVEVDCDSVYELTKYLIENKIKINKATYFKIKGVHIKARKLLGVSGINEINTTWSIWRLNYQKYMKYKSYLEENKVNYISNLRSFLWRFEKIDSYSLKIGLEKMEERKRKRLLQEQYESESDISTVYEGFNDDNNMDY